LSFIYILTETNDVLKQELEKLKHQRILLKPLQNNALYSTAVMAWIIKQWGNSSKDWLKLVPGPVWIKFSS